MNKNQGTKSEPDTALRAQFDSLKKALEPLLETKKEATISRTLAMVAERRSQSFDFGSISSSIINARGLLPRLLGGVAVAIVSVFVLVNQFQGGAQTGITNIEEDDLTGQPNILYAADESSLDNWANGMGDDLLEFGEAAASQFTGELPKEIEISNVEGLYEQSEEDESTAGEFYDYAL
jgi:hypothetical protein